MIIVIKCEETDNIIGLKEDVAMRLEGVADIIKIDVYAEGGSKDGREKGC